MGKKRVIGKVQAKRLLKLADFLETRVSPTMFNMGQFRDEDFESVHRCGAVGCAMGWAPFLEGRVFSPLPEEVKTDLLGSSDLSWSKYGVRVFGVDTYEDPLWEFLFSGEWEGFDDTPVGAAQRIRYVVFHDGDLSELEGHSVDYNQYEPAHSDVDTYYFAETGL